MRFPRLKTAALAVVVAGLALGGCNADTLALSPNTPGGISDPSVYTLVAVNNKPLPVEVRNDASGRVSIVEGSLRLAGGTFQQSLVLSETGPLASSTPTPRASATQGTTTIRGDRIQFHASDGGEWEGVMTANRVDYSVPGNSSPVAFTFQR
jgi:hypothetical protein